MMEAFDRVNIDKLYCFGAFEGKVGYVITREPVKSDAYVVDVEGKRYIVPAKFLSKVEAGI